MSELPIESLIRTRSNELGLRATALVRRAGYKNIAKGLRRLQELHSGFFVGARGLIQGLPAALDLPEIVIRKAIEDSRHQIVQAKEEAWRATFKPHAVILTEKSVPEPIFIAAIIGIDQLKCVTLDADRSPLGFIDQALEALGNKLERWKGHIPCFGKPTGIIINYTPDRAVRFDLDGQPLEIFDCAYRLGEASLSISGRECTSDELRAVFFGGKSDIRRNISPYVILSS
jgi:hypothetical protein